MRIAAKAELACVVCAVSYHRKPSYIAKHGSSYCSRQCMAVGYKTRLRGDANPNFTGRGQQKCDQCGELFSNRGNVRKYCSRKCFHLANAPMLSGMSLRASKSPRSARIKKLAPLRSCPQCGVDCRNSKAVTCSRACGYAMRVSRTAQADAPAPNLTCFHCNAKYHSHSKDRQFCSYQCFVLSGGPTRAGLAAARMFMKYGAKKDANHIEIVDALRAMGLAVYDLSSAGCGIPDCLVWAADQWRLVEIKNPKTSYGRRGLNNIQKKWIAEWRGGPIYILKSIDDAIHFGSGRFHLVQICSPSTVIAAAEGK